jgi:hypothetical protein
MVHQWLTYTIFAQKMWMVSGSLFSIVYLNEKSTSNILMLVKSSSFLQWIHLGETNTMGYAMLTQTNVWGQQTKKLLQTRKLTTKDGHHPWRLFYLFTKANLNCKCFLREQKLILNSAQLLCSTSSVLLLFSLDWL